MSPPGSRAVFLPGHCQHPAPLQPLCPSTPSSKALTARNRKPYSDLLKLQGIYRLSDRTAQGGSAQCAWRKAPSVPIPPQAHPCRYTEAPGATTHPSALPSQQRTPERPSSDQPHPALRPGPARRPLTALWEVHSTRHSPLRALCTEAFNHLQAGSNSTPPHLRKCVLRLRSFHGQGNGLGSKHLSKAT